MVDSQVQAAIQSPFKKDEAASWGVQAPLIVWSAPAGAAALVGQPLVGNTLSVDGTYVFLIPLAGLASALKVHVRATLTTATLTSSGPDLLASLDPIADTVSTHPVLLAGTGDGALSTGTLQTATVDMNGARYARYSLEVASAGTAEVTIAEYTGL